MPSLQLNHDWYSRPVPANVSLGERTWLYSAFAFLHYQSRADLGLLVGHDTGIYHGTFFDLGPMGEVLIGDYCSLVGAIIATNARVEIGSYSLIAHEVVIADHSYSAPCDQVAQVARAEGDAVKTIIGENVWIGARSTVLGGVQIGEGAIIGAATLVRESVPPFAIYAGNPGRVVGDVRRRR